MHLLDRVEYRWINDQDLQDISDEACRAIVDLLALAIYADGDADPAEISAYESLIATLPFVWDEPEALGLEDYAREAKERAAELDDDTYERRLYELGAVIPDEIGPQVFSMLVAILVIDEILDDAEGEILGMFCEALEVDDHEARMLFDEIVEELGLVEVSEDEEEVY